MDGYPSERTDFKSSSDFSDGGWITFAFYVFQDEVEDVLLPLCESFRHSSSTCTSRRSIRSICLHVKQSGTKIWHNRLL